MFENLIDLLNGILVKQQVLMIYLLQDFSVMIGVSFVYTREVVGGRVKRIHLIMEKAFEDGHALWISGEWEEIVVDNGY